jgi:hypothetical protein
MATVSFFTNDNYGGDETTISVSGTMGTAYSSQPDYDSVKVSASTWVVVWNESDFGGDFLLINPSTNLSDLNNVPRTGGGDWKNQIRSLQVYSSEPSWWSSGVPQ